MRDIMGLIFLLVMVMMVKMTTSSQVQNNNNEGRDHPNNSNDPNALYTSTLCSNTISLDSIQYDLSNLQYTLLKYQNLESTFYINLCQNYTSPCAPDDTLCQLVYPNQDVYHLAYSSTINVHSNGIAGLILNYNGQPCIEDKNLVYNTTIDLLCDTNTDSMVELVSKESCKVSVIIKSQYACGVYQADDQRSTFNLVVFFATLFGTILMFICIAGCIYTTNKLCNRFGARFGGGYHPIGDHDDDHQHRININNDNAGGSSSNIQIYKHDIIDNTMNNENNGNGDANNTNINNRSMVDNSCKVCFDNKVNTVLLDCGHSSLCLECTEKMKKCPICRSDIKKVVKIYQL